MRRDAILLAGLGLVAASLVAAQTHSPSRSVYLEDLTWPEVRDAILAGKTTAIIYAGSTEQNGPHMVLGKHNFIAYYAAGQIAQTLGDALVYPTLPFAPAGDPATKTGHMRFPGTVSLTPEVFSAVLRQVAQSALAAGFKQVYLMGDHGGGQDDLRRTAAEVDAQQGGRGAHVYYVPDLYFKEKEQMRAYLVAHGIARDAHAGTDDTSELMFLDSAERWIRRDQLAASDSTQQPLTGVDGDPTAATPALGRMFLDWKVRDAVEQIRRLRAGQPH